MHTSYKGISICNEAYLQTERAQRHTLMVALSLEVFRSCRSLKRREVIDIVEYVKKKYGNSVE